MGRLACVDLPALPLQLLVQRHPEWADHPVAVVDEDKPQGLILWVNERARRRRILPGLRYAAALSLGGDLRAGVVTAAEIDECVGALAERLRRFTPDVEPKSEEPGAFWLDASGLERLYPSATAWAKAVYGALSGVNEPGGISESSPAAVPLRRPAEVAAGDQGGRPEQGKQVGNAGTVRADQCKPERYEATVVMGFSRFATYAVAKAQHGIVVFRNGKEERRAMRRVALDRLGIDPGLRDALGKLAVTTVGAFLDLPARGVRERFGAEAHRLHCEAAGKEWSPLEPVASAPPLAARAELEQPDGDVHSLLFVVKRLLDVLLVELAGRGEGVAAVHLDLVFDTGLNRRETVRPAEPTLDAKQLLELVRLRLEAVFGHGGVAMAKQRAARAAARAAPTEGKDRHRLRIDEPPRGVEEFELVVEGVKAPGEQLRLFLENPRRDLDAGNRALARVSTELGEHAVAHAQLREGHLPEATFLWQPMRSLEPADPLASHGLQLMRRVLRKPLALPPRRHQLRDDGWLIRGAEHGPVARFVGPYVVSGGWWVQSVHREYHFAETQRGDLLWVYYDRRRRRWYLHGTVE